MFSFILCRQWLWLPFELQIQTVFPEKVTFKWIFQLHYIDSTHFYQLTSILWVVPNSVQNQNQRFCTTATKVILPSTTYQASAVDNFALYVLLTNFCSWKIVLKNLVAQKTLHKEISTCLVSCECCSELLGVRKPTNPLQMHFIVNSSKCIEMHF